MLHQQLVLTCWWSDLQAVTGYYDLSSLETPCWLTEKSVRHATHKCVTFVAECKGSSVITAETVSDN